jgi:hypothetical protein
MKSPWSCLALLLLAGCGVVESAVDLPAQTVRAVTPGKKETGPQVDPAELQETLLRFSDSLLRRAARGIEELHRPGKPGDPAEILRWKIALGTETVSIATGTNSLANLLDMTVFVSLTRGVLVTYWKPAVYEDSTNPLLKSFEEAEVELGQLLDRVLTPDQRSEFRQTIETWRKEHPLAENTLGARALGFAAQARGKADAPQGSLFNLVKLDPLAGLDPATREIAQTRAYAERVLYVLQKFPMLLRWQTELLAIDAAEIPAAKQVVASAAQIAASADRIAVTAEKIPDRLSKEREEIVKALREQEKEVHSVLTAGTQMSASLNTTLTTFDGVMKRLGVGEPKPPGPEAPPVRIQDVTQAVAQLDATTKHLTELLQALDHTLSTADLARLTAQVTPVVQRAEAGGKEVVDYVFWKSCLLIGLVLAAALIYRFLGPRLAPKKP